MLLFRAHNLAPSPTNMLRNHLKVFFMILTKFNNNYQGTMRPMDKVPCSWASSRLKLTKIGFFTLDKAPTEPNPFLSMILASHSIFSFSVRLEPRPAFVNGLFYLKAKVCMSLINVKMFRMFTSRRRIA